MSDCTQYIGAYAFCDCNSLSSIDIPDSVTEIADGAFQRCIHLSTINIPKSIEWIGENVFDYCKKLSSVSYDGLIFKKKNDLLTALNCNNVNYMPNIFDNTNLK